MAAGNPIMEMLLKAKATYNTLKGCDINRLKSETNWYADYALSRYIMTGRLE